ncbi:YtxH domain-containing protein [Brenneria populi subsp. brevivirga]|uniref:YtxH domain-containing protein n=1 Tax=Brenneria populi TaxID=1505588 RepID=A0ABU6JRF3_9GAMM|nr:YtxH domain-containing protein [Brenneria populi subsp. brevivirga]MEC5343145.1 YtxH domain-containing protein [Brenneria populi Li et al. 2015]
MKQPDYPYAYYPYYTPYPPAQPQPQTPYRQANGSAHLITGVVAGAALAYLLSNREVQRGITTTASKAWGTVRGEVEELKERLADLQAELEYYRNREQDAE